ncbi:translation initiation factor, partial [Rhodococcus sp. IEGM 248]|nr:translation initiation factor [Rhodococcus sp. IEGM 248]
MPPRRRSGAAAPDHLTAENLETLAAAIAEGKRATVYLREAMPSLGLEAGASAKVISVQGNTLLIRPKGVDDELPFEAEELLMRRIPAPKPAPAPAPAAPK